MSGAASAPEIQVLRRPVTVFHIEDDELWIGAVFRLVQQLSDFKWLGSAKTGTKGLGRCRELRPAVVILDLRLPDVDGFAILEGLCAHVVRPRILLLSCRDDDVTLFHTSSASVAGMILKGANFDADLRQALTAIAAGSRYLSADVREKASRFRSDPNAYYKFLSEREVGVLKLIASGFSDDEVAEMLGLGCATAHSHRQKIMAKVGVHSSTKLMAWAREKGFI